MKKLSIASLGLAGILMGCLDTGLNGNGEAGEKKGTPGGKSSLPVALSTSSTNMPTWVQNSTWPPFTSPFGTGYVWTDNNVVTWSNQAVERQHVCSENEVVTGFGARVSNGNVTGVRLYCTKVELGNLTSTTERVTGGTPIEATVQPVFGWVTIGVGGVVNGSKFVRATVRECAWNFGTGTVNHGNCRDRSSDGNLAVEMKLNVTAVPAELGGSQFAGPTYERYALTGLGFTVGYEGMKVVKLIAGRLAAVGVSRTQLSGGSLYFSYPVPTWAEGVSVHTNSGGGDADLYIKINTPVSLEQYNCASTSSSNFEYCNIFNGHAAGYNLNILIHPYLPYSGMNLTGIYF